MSSRHHAISPDSLVLEGAETSLSKGPSLLHDVYDLESEKLDLGDVIPLKLTSNWDGHFISVLGVYYLIDSPHLIVG